MVLKQCYIEGKNVKLLIGLRMLSFTRKTEYGLIAVVHLAALAEGELISARQMAVKTGGSRSLLMNVLKDLATCGYVESVRGSRGGYRLAGDPAKINVAELVTGLEGPVHLTECVVNSKHSDQNSNCDMLSSCPIIGPVRLLQEKLNEVLASLTLADMVASVSLASVAGNSE